MFRSTVYLNALLDTTTGLPVIVEVSISSSPPGSSTCRLMKEQWVNLFSVERNSLQEGIDDILKTVHEDNTLAWVRPFLDESQDHAVKRSIFRGSVLPRLLNVIRSTVELAGWPVGDH